MNSKLKKLLAVLLVLSVFILGACSDKKDDSATNDNTNQNENQADAGKEDAAKEDEGNTDESSEEAGIATLSAEEFDAAIQDASTLLVDARLNDVYNGWAVNGNARGGHIKGATDFSSLWLTVDYDDKENLEKLTREEVLAEAMENKGITADKTVVVYDTNGTDAIAVAEYFKSKGIENISCFNASEYIADESNELVKYAKNEVLLPAEVVKNIAAGEIPEGFTNASKIVIVDVRWGDEENSGYSEGHIPASVHVNSDGFEPPFKDEEQGIEEWMLADDETLAKLLLDTGIDADTCVISTSPENMAAARFSTICKYMGVKDTRVMNGGYKVWNSLGYELEKGVNEPKALTDFGTEYPAKQEVIDTIEEAKEILKDENSQLVDNRTWEEFIGESTGYSYHNKAGRIEGCVFGHAGLNSSYSMYYYRNIDQTMRNQDEIMNLWKEDGLDTNKHMSFFCGSGWRAAEILWYSYAMGMENTSLYSDGWIGWSNDGLPFITGEAKNE